MAAVVVFCFENVHFADVLDGTVANERRDFLKGNLLPGVLAEGAEGHVPQLDDAICRVFVLVPHEKHCRAAVCHDVEHQGTFMELDGLLLDVAGAELDCVSFEKLGLVVFAVGDAEAGFGIQSQAFLLEP